MEFEVTRNGARLTLSSDRYVWCLIVKFCPSSPPLSIRKERQWKTPECSRKTKWGTKTMVNKADRDKKKKREKEEGKLYLDNPIISHLQSTSMDARSLHQPAHCEDRASSAGQLVDFPLSFSQRGPACPYISRSGHTDSHDHPSAATNTATQLWPQK